MVTTNYKNQMQKAMQNLAKVLEKQGSIAAQETNIFKILKVDQHEIRHGAFLEFLLDPERNPVLADCFLKAWLDEITSELALDDEQVSKIIEGEYEYIDHIESASQYSEIPFDNKGSNNRIDHAFEVKLKGTTRVFVFEYKHNGVLQNDLGAYRAYVEKQYEGKRAEIYCFILELGHKTHDKPEFDGWHFISRETLIEAVRSTLAEARRNDMQATRLYLEQYLEILQPDPKAFDLLKDYRSELWTLWNPEISREFDPNAEYFTELLEKYIVAVDDRDLLNSFEYHLLLDWAVAESVAFSETMSNVSIRINSGWVRLRPKNSPNNFYLLTYLDEGEDGQLYLVIKLRSWHDTRAPIKESKAQYQLLHKALAEHKQIGQWYRDLSEPDALRFVTLNNMDNEVEVVSKRGQPSNCKTPYDLSIVWRWPISLQTFEQIARGQHQPEIFRNWLQDLEYWADAIVES